MTLPAYVLQLLTNATEPVSALSGEQAGSDLPEPLLITADGYKVDPVNGVVYGPRGFPIRRINGGGYVKHYRPEGGKMCHRIIWEAVNGQPIPEGMEINHINGIKHDNRIENLELVTRLENMRHAQRTGLIHRKLTAPEVVAIRESRETCAEIAATHRISVSHARAIRAGTYWRTTHTPANEE